MHTFIKLGYEMALSIDIKTEVLDIFLRSICTTKNRAMYSHSSDVVIGHIDFYPIIVCFRYKKLYRLLNT